MILAGRSFFEIEELYRKRFRRFVLISSGLFAALAAVTPPSCVPAALRRARVGHAGPLRVEKVLSPPDRLEAATEALMARRLASGAMRWVEFVLEDDLVGTDGAAFAAASAPTQAPAPERAARVQIGEIVPIEPVQVEIELDEDLSARTTSKPTAKSPDFAILEMVRPSYPDVSLWAEVEGLVTLKATVNPSGSVTRIATLSNEADRFCEDAATGALRDWRFKPMAVDGQRVWFSVVVPFRFRIE